MNIIKDFWMKRYTEEKLDEQGFNEPFKNLAHFAPRLSPSNIYKFLSIFIFQTETSPGKIMEHNIGHFQRYQYEEDEYQGKMVGNVLQDKMEDAVSGMKNKEIEEFLTEGWTPREEIAT